MWALRRACATSARSHGLRLGAPRTCARLESSASCLENKPCNEKHSEFRLDELMPVKRVNNCSKAPYQFSTGARSFASQVGAKSGGEEDDLEDGFSELGTPEVSTAAKDSSFESDSDNLISEPELSDNEVEVAPEDGLTLDTEIDTDETLSQRKNMLSDLFWAILNDPVQSVYNILDKYVADGKELGRAEVSYALLGLRRRRMFGKALQLSEWLEKNKTLEFKERDYASRLDLIAKVRGIQRAEDYIRKIPESFAGEVVYRTLLANVVSAGDVKKSEEIFNKMKALGFPMTSFACNQLLILYRRIDKKKIADVLLLMEKENIKPSSFTYKILIEAKGQSNDVVGMDKLVETMKADGIEADVSTKAVLAKYYAIAGQKEKAVAIVKELEGDNLRKNRNVCHLLIPIYGELGMSDHVERVWKVCKPEPRTIESMAAMNAWGKLKEIEKAEAVFEEMSKRNSRLTSRHYSQLLRIYADNKMLNKGKDLVMRMGDKGVQIGPYTWDALVRLYVEAGEVEKADSILHKATQQSEGKTVKPLFGSYMALINQYAERGDVHNAEKIFHRIKEGGYAGRIKPYLALVRAYQNAKVPAYGMTERLKADNIFPNRYLAAQLAQLDAFRKTTASELLD